MSKLTIEIDFDPAPSTASTLIKIDNEPIGVIQAIGVNVAVNSTDPAITVTLPYAEDDNIDFSDIFKSMVKESENKLRKLMPYIKIEHSNNYFKTSKQIH